jgi:diguanylate cyclase (GGDEF)-like protein
MPITVWMIASAAPPGQRALLRAGAGALLCAILISGALNLLGVAETASAVIATAGFALAALLAAARAVWIRRSSTAWAVLAGGLALWTPAFAMYALPAQPWAGAPAASDLFWLSGYLAFYATIVALAKERIVRHAGVWLDGLGGALALASVAVAVIVPLVLDRVDGSPVPAGIALAYPLADALLLTLLITLGAMSGWRPGRALTALAGAMLVLIVSDLPYFLGTAENGGWAPGSLVDTLWLVAAAAMAAAAWQQPAVGASRRSGPIGMLVFPALSAATGVAVLLHAALDEAPLAAIALATLALGTATLRMLLSYRELHELLESRRLSRTDDLTGLANRRRLLHSLERAIGDDDRGAAVLLLGVDNFKELNDTLGHEAGDAVLCGVANRLANALRPGDLAARVGGDEFGVLLREGDEELALVVARRLEVLLSAPLTVAGVRLRIAASIGVVVAPEHGSDPDRLLRRADLAMTRARTGPRAIATYSDELEARALGKLQLAGELSRALEEDELVLHYQPVSDATSGEIVAVEALVRWQHPERGLLLPGAFLPALERTTLAHDFSRHVLNAAVAHARVIYNRLEGDETNGLLQIDASVNYGLQQELGVALTTEQLQQDTPYNTYTRPGLPPTPIEAPGDAAIEAAAAPTEGDWYYYVTTNLRTGETKFASTYNEFLSYKREFQKYCETSDAC